MLIKYPQPRSARDTPVWSQALSTACYAGFTCSLILVEVVASRALFETLTIPKNILNAAFGAIVGSDSFAF